MKQTTISPKPLHEYYRQLAADKENTYKIMYNEMTDREHIDKLYQLVEDQGYEISQLKLEVAGLTEKVDSLIESSLPDLR